MNRFTKRSIHRNLDKEMDIMWKFILAGLFLNLLIAAGIAFHVVPVSHSSESPRMDVQDVYYSNWDPCTLATVECDPVASQNKKKD